MPSQPEDFPFTPEFELLLLKAKDALVKVGNKGRISADTFPEDLIDAVRRYLTVIQAGFEDSDTSDERKLNNVFLSLIEICGEHRTLTLDECYWARVLASHLERSVTTMELLHRKYRERRRRR